MKKLLPTLFIFFVMMVLLGVLPVQSQNSVHLLQSFQYDALISRSFYGEAGLLYVDFSDVDVTETIIAARGGIPINRKFELVFQWAYVKITPENSEALSGMADIGLYGRYNFFSNRRTAVSVGPFLTLPIGEEEVGQDNLNFGGFCALRHNFKGGVALTGNLGLEFYEETKWTGNKVEEEYTMQLLFGAGLIFPVSRQTHIITELYLKDDMDYSVLSGGLDYKLGSAKLRAGIGIGLDDGAPDLMIAGGFVFTL